MPIGNIQAGIPLTPTTGSAQVVVPRDGVLIGFFAAATGTVVLYDTATTAGAATGTTILGSLTIPAVGWYSFPVTFQNGLVANCSGKTTFVVA